MTKELIEAYEEIQKKKIAVLWTQIKQSNSLSISYLKEWKDKSK